MAAAAVELPPLLVARVAQVVAALVAATSRALMGPLILVAVAVAVAALQWPVAAALVSS